MPHRITLATECDVKATKEELHWRGSWGDSYVCRLSSNRSIGLHLNHFQLIDGGEERPLNTCINTRRKYRSSSTRATLQVLVQLLNLKVFLYHSFFLLWILESVCLCVEREGISTPLIPKARKLFLWLVIWLTVWLCAWKKKLPSADYRLQEILDSGRHIDELICRAGDLQGSPRLPVNRHIWSYLKFNIKTHYLANVYSFATVKLPRSN